MAYHVEYPYKGYTVAVFLGSMAVQIFGTQLLAYLGGRDQICEPFGVWTVGCLGRSPMTQTSTSQGWAEMFRFVSEQVPQAGLQIHMSLFIHEKYGEESVFVFISVVVSVLVGIPAVLSACNIVCKEIAAFCGDFCRAIGEWCEEFCRAIGECCGVIGECCRPYFQVTQWEEAQLLERGGTEQ